MTELRRIEFFLPGPTFTWREKRKTHTGKCPKRGHCTRTFEGRHPETKGNRKQVTRRGRHTGITESKRTIAAEAALVEALVALPQRPAEPLGDVVLGAVFVFQPPESWTPWKHEAAAAEAIRPTGHHLGDRGNLLKMLEDALAAAGYYHDDSRIVDGPVGKAWGPVPGYRVSIQELPPQPTKRAEWDAIVRGAV